VSKQGAKKKFSSCEKFIFVSAQRKFAKLGCFTNNGGDKASTDCIGISF